MTDDRDSGWNKWLLLGVVLVGLPLLAMGVSSLFMRSQEKRSAQKRDESKSGSGSDGSAPPSGGETGRSGSGEASGPPAAASGSGASQTAGAPSETSTARPPSETAAPPTQTATRADAGSSAGSSTGSAGLIAGTETESTGSRAAESSAGTKAASPSKTGTHGGDPSASSPATGTSQAAGGSDVPDGNVGMPSDLPHGSAGSAASSSEADATSTSGTSSSEAGATSTGATGSSTGGAPGASSGGAGATSTTGSSNAKSGKDSGQKTAGESAAANAAASKPGKTASDYWSQKPAQRLRDQVLQDRRDAVRIPTAETSIQISGKEHKLLDLSPWGARVAGKLQQGKRFDVGPQKISGKVVWSNDEESGLQFEAPSDDDQRGWFKELLNGAKFTDKHRHQRRQWTRAAMDAEATLEDDRDQSRPCRVKNLSLGGAWLELGAKDAETVSNEERVRLILPAGKRKGALALAAVVAERRGNVIHLRFLTPTAGLRKRLEQFLAASLGLKIKE